MDTIELLINHYINDEIIPSRKAGKSLIARIQKQDRLQKKGITGLYTYYRIKE